MKRKDMDLVEKIMFPTKGLTYRNETKWVRAIGEIGVIFPMLPWTILCFFVVGTLGILAIMFEGPIDWVLEWWRNV